MQIAISALPQNGYVCFTNLTWNLSHGAFGLHTSCVSEDTLWTASLKVAGHIHNLLLSLVHAALLVLVYDTHLVTCFANAVLAVGGVFHVSVHDFAMVIGRAGVTSKNCLRCHPEQKKRACWSKPFSSRPTLGLLVEHCLR